MGSYSSGALARRPAPPTSSSPQSRPLMPCASSLGSLAPISWSCLPFASAQMYASIDNEGTAHENQLSVRRRILLTHHKQPTAPAHSRDVESLKPDVPREGKECVSKS